MRRKGRNQNGLGTVEYLSPTKCRFRIKQGEMRRTGPVVDATGDRVKDRREAIKAFNAANRPEEPPSLRMQDFLRSQVAKANLAPKTRDLYDRIIENYIVNDPIDKDLKDLTPHDIEAWQGRLFKRLSRTSTQRYMQFVAAQVKKAKQLRLIPSNPFDDVTLPKRDQVKKRVLSKAELARFYKLKWSPTMKTAIRLMAHGLRKSEACGVMYEDFDGEGLTISRQVIEVAGKLEVLDLKTANSYRWVPVDAELKKLLKKGKGYVLKGSTGKALRGRSLHKWWTDTLKGTEFEGMTPHDLRSTFGMLLLEATVDVRTASEIMGHSPAVLAKIYARSRKEVKLDALRKVNELSQKLTQKRKTG